MKNILLCLATDFLWLFEMYGFRIVDSLWESSFGGQGMIAMSNGSLQIRFLSDRNQICIEFHPLHLEWPDDEYVTTDILFTQIVGGYIDTAMVNDQTIIFIKSHFDDIITLFSGSSTNDLITKCKKLKKERAKRLFG